LISPVITDEDNMPLCAIPNADEIKQTLFSLGSDKSPGPDGMPALFYKHYWKVISQDLIEVVTSFFTRDHILTEINQTFITLIPKSGQSIYVNQFVQSVFATPYTKLSQKFLLLDSFLFFTKSFPHGNQPLCLVELSNTTLLLLMKFLTP
jgi:hypothetical protein